MSSQRLSRLQKWILTETQKSANGFLTRRNIFVSYYGLRKPEYSDWHGPYGDPGLSRRARSASAAIATSLKGLELQGLVKRVSWWNLTREERASKGIRDWGEFSELVGLTDVGKKIARNLIANSCTNGTEVNNKAPSLNHNFVARGYEVNNKGGHREGEIHATD
jgi:hypothetical protein